MVPDETLVDGSLVEGMPEGATIRSRELAALLSRGAYRPRAEPRRDGIMSLSVHPVSDEAVDYVRRPRDGKVCHRSPSAGLRTSDAGTDIAMTWAVPDDEATEADFAVDLPDAVYRGMCFEEFRAVVEDGRVRSHGLWNMSGQEGMTLWTSDPETAAHYANGFAPMHRRAAFGRPAYVLAIGRPDDAVRSRGMPENEVGTMGSVDSELIHAVWEGEVYDFDPGSIDLVLQDGIWRTGSMSQPTSSVVWRRLDDEEFERALGHRPFAARNPVFRP